KQQAAKGIVSMKTIAAMVSLLLSAGVWPGYHSLAWSAAARGNEPGANLLRSAKSGRWSAPATWEGGKVPDAGASVQIRSGHTVIYDMPPGKDICPPAVRSIHVAGALTFARDRDTLLGVGLVKIQPGDDASENGFDCDAHAPALKPGQPRPALEVGTPNQPIPAQYTATIQLVHFPGMDKESCPAIVCCGGRMDFHGAPLSGSWVKLGAKARAGSTEVTLAEPVTGWRSGDGVILMATLRQNKIKKTFRASTRDSTATEERIITAFDKTRLTLDKPLAHDHQCDGAYRGEVADLSRNVVVESADPGGARGHTMYHRNSAGAISYAEFRHLGK